MLVCNATITTYDTDCFVCNDNRAAKEVLQRKIALLQQKDTRYPSVVQPRALAGLAALGVAVACMFASYAILNTSNGKAVADWTVAPTVYLAAITALANSAIVLGHMEAVPVGKLGYV